MIAYLNGFKISLANHDIPMLDQNDDLNQIYKDGLYKTSGNAPKNAPGQWGFLLVMSYDSNTQYQFFASGLNLYFRIISGTDHSSPSNWKTIPLN